MIVLDAARSIEKNVPIHPKCSATSAGGTNPSLQERELLKLNGLAAAVADAQRARGPDDPEAGLVGETAMVVFKVSFARWLDGGAGRDLAPIQRGVLAALGSLTKPS